MAAELVDLFIDERGVEWRAVGELERPGAHVQPGLVTSEVVSAVDDAAESYVREGAADVGEHLDLGHGRSSLVGQVWPRHAVLTAR